MELPKFLKFKPKYKSGSFKKTIEINPLSYWKNILILTSIILLIAGVLSFAVYYMATNGMLVDKKSRNEVQDLVATNLNDKGLKRLVDSFTENTLKRTEIINSKIIFPDPSERTGIKPAVQNPAR